MKISNSKRLNEKKKKKSKNDTRLLHEGYRVKNKIFREKQTKKRKVDKLNESVECSFAV